MINAKNISIYFKNSSRRKDYILENISLVIEKPEIFGLLGPNGAGKTTFIKTLLGLHVWYEGDLVINGFDRKHGKRNFLESIGYVPENILLPEEETAINFLYRYSIFYGISPEVLSDKISFALSLTDLESVQQNKIKTFSKGMKKRLMFSHAILHQPNLLLLDEPFEGMDPIQKIRIREFLKDRKINGKTTLVSSHELGEIEKSCTKVAIMCNKGLQRPIEMTPSKNLEAIFKQVVS